MRLPDIRCRRDRRIASTTSLLVLGSRTRHLERASKHEVQPRLSPDEDQVSQQTRDVAETGVVERGTASHTRRKLEARRRSRGEIRFVAAATVTGRVGADRAREQLVTSLLQP